MLNVSSFQGAVTPAQQQVELKSPVEQQKFEIPNERTKKLNSDQQQALAAIPGSHLVSVEEMLNIFSENGIINETERTSLAEKITDRTQMSQAILDLKGPGWIANTAFKMQNGVMLDNGILSLPNSLSHTKALAALTAREVGIIEAAEGRDMSLGQSNGLLGSVATDKQYGIIQGELSLKDYALLKKEFSESFKPGSHDKADMEATFNRLLEALMEDDKKPKTEAANKSATS